MAIETVRKSDASGKAIPDGTGARVRVMFNDPKRPDMRADLTDDERAAFIAGDMRKINELGGYLHLVMSIPKIGTHGAR